MNTTTTGTTSGFQAWLENNTRAQLRFYSPYLWLYEILISYVDTIQDSTIYEADRSQYLTKAQQEAVSSLNNLKLILNKKFLTYRIPFLTLFHKNLYIKTLPPR